MENMYEYCNDCTPLVGCNRCRSYGPSLSNKDTEDIVGLMLDEALQNHSFNLDDVKLSIVNNIQDILKVQDDLTNYKEDLNELLNNYIETDELDLLKDNLENSDIALGESIQARVAYAFHINKREKIK